MSLDAIRDLTADIWPVELVEVEGLWDTTGMQTLMFLPPFLGPSATLLVHRLAYTYPTPWKTRSLAGQLGLNPRRVLEALKRATEFDIVAITDYQIEVPSRMGPLTASQARKLPRRLRLAYDRLVDQE